MALYATNRFAGDGSTTSYEFNFVGKYLDRAHVKAYQEDNYTLVRTPVAITASNFLNDTTLHMLPVTPAGSTLVIYRDTPKAPLVDFVNGSRFTEHNLDTATRQGAFIAVEGADAVSPDGTEGVINQLVGASRAAVAARDQAGEFASLAATSASAATASASAATASASAATASASAATASASAATASASGAGASAALADNSRILADNAAISSSLSAVQAAQAANTVAASIPTVTTAAEGAALAFARANALLGVGIGTSYVDPEGDLIMTYVPPVTSVYIDADGNLAMDY